MTVQWLLVLVVYAAPADAIDWNGPWAFGMAHMEDQPYPTEAKCKIAGITMVKRLHKGMRAPIRIKCVPFGDSLPVNAPR